MEAVGLLLSLKSTNTRQIIIFDWDDTLFPTEYFKTRMEMLHNHELIPPEINLNLRTIASNIIKVITNAKLCGNVSIISNATIEWLQLCIDVIPEIIPLLETINIISAQDSFKQLSNDTSNDPEKWKVWTFYHYIDYTIKIYEQLSKNNYYNILSIGDSIQERNALKINTSIFKKNYPDFIFSKTIKLIEKPTFKIIIDQLLYIIDLLSNVENIGYLDHDDYNFV